MLEALLRLLPGGMSKGGDADKTRATTRALGRLQALFVATDDPRLRHLAFMVLMRLGGMAPTLFREEDDFGPLAGAPCCKCMLHEDKNTSARSQDLCQAHKIGHCICL